MRIFNTVFLLLFFACSVSSGAAPVSLLDSVVGERESLGSNVPMSVYDIAIERDLVYDQYTLKDRYYYGDTRRIINWKAIRRELLFLEQRQQPLRRWGVLQNYQNRNGKPPRITYTKRHRYGPDADSLGIDRDQAIPLYTIGDTISPILYQMDGALIALTDTVATGSKYIRGRIESLDIECLVPREYVRRLDANTIFNHFIFVDRRQQQIVTLERTAPGVYRVRSANPATTGRDKPPYAKPTPLGTFVLQQKKTKMFFTKDGSSQVVGYAPWANRFCCGAYIHGVPVNKLKGSIIEYSNSLGTIPRSHMCVRNASSHSKFIYDNFPTLATLVIVIE